MNEFWETMDAYNEAFGEYFPTESCYASNAEMIELMRKAIETGEPYEPQLPSGSYS